MTLQYLNNIWNTISLIKGANMLDVLEEAEASPVPALLQKKNTNNAEKFVSCI